MRALDSDLREEIPLISGDRQSWFITALFMFGLIVCLAAAGCRNKEESKPAPAASKSTVMVKVLSEGITLSTPSTEFRLTPSGALTGALVGASGQNSWEEESLDFSPIVSSSKKEHAGARFDLAGAKVLDASGKLGALGKHIEIAGAIPETNLAETLDLEIYDDFPNVALLSLSIRNTGPTDVPLEWVKLQRHQFVS